MRPARILLCHNHYAKAGGESQVFDNLARGLKEKGHEIETYVRTNADLAKESPVRGAYGMLQDRVYRRVDSDVRRLIESFRPDVAIVQNVFPLMTPALYRSIRRLGVPILQATYNYRFICPQAELYSHDHICELCVTGSVLNCVRLRCYRDSFAESALYASMVGWHRFRGTFANAIDVFQVPDEFMKKKLTEGGLPGERMVVNVNPFFVHDHQAQTRHDGYVAFVGRLVRRKGVLTLIDGLRQATKVRAVIVGEGEVEAEVRRRIADYDIGDRVSFVGPKWGRDLEDVLARSSAVVVPSEWYDNLPLILCHANALGKPVIASDINGLPEYVSPGINGFLFPPGNAVALAEALSAISNMTPAAYRDIAVSSRQFAETRLDFETHYGRLSSTLSGMLRKS